MRKNVLLVCLTLAVLLGWQSANAHHPRSARVDVWTAPCHDHRYEDEARLEVFLRLSERGYITVYQITPYGRAEILYPLAHHYQHELHPARDYRLSDLADDIYLYDEDEGYAQIGVIFTPEPAALAPWLESSFCEAGLALGRNKIIYAGFDFPRIFARVEADIRIHLGMRCVPSFVVTPIYVRPRVIVKRPEQGYHCRKPYPKYKDGDHDRRGYGRPSWRAEREPAEPVRRTYEKRGAEMRQVTFPARTPDRGRDPVVNVSSSPSRRERREASKSLQSRHEEKQKPASRRSRETRADD